MDEAKRLSKELGEHDRLTSIECAKYQAILTVIEESGYMSEWYDFLKKTWTVREEYKRITE